MKIGILGAGTWGVGLAYLLYNNGHGITVWSALPEEIDNLEKTGRHKSLPDTVLPKGINYTKDIEKAIKGMDIVIFVVPSVFMRKTAEIAAEYLDEGTIIATASKGIEQNSFLTMSGIIDDVLAKARPNLKYDIVALSGPTHAEEVVKGLPTSIVSACENEEVAFKVAQIFSSTCMRAYANTDILGVELCGALKNIIAIAAGINHGMGFGDNSAAMLITRGIAEMRRIGVAIGCNKDTFMGLAGIGDLIVTATSRHSRNNRCGELVGRGMKYEDAVSEIGMVVEGYHALEAAMAMSQKYGVEMPIVEAVYDILKKGVSPKEAMVRLMTRNIKNEIY